MIPLAQPSVDEEDVAAVRDVLLTGQLVQGRQVAAFESAIAARVGTRHAVAVANGTAALHLSLLALKVGPGDRVAVPTYSWPATANSVVLCGAEPVFVDIDRHTFAMDPDALDEVLVRTNARVVLPVHPFGGAADMPRLLDVAGHHAAVVVEDAACALGTTIGSRQAGSFGKLGCFSFHPRKAVTTGEGGVITTDDAALARTIRALRNHGLDPEALEPDFVVAGFNLRMTEFQAALGQTQLGKLNRIIAARRDHAAAYAPLLADSGVAAPMSLDGSSHVYQSYVVLLPSVVCAARQRVIREMAAAGIQTTIGTYHIPMIRYYRERFGFVPGDFPPTDDVAARALSLPMFERLTAQERRTVARTLAVVLKGLATPPA